MGFKSSVLIATKLRLMKKGRKPVSVVYMISDLHLGHKNIYNLRKDPFTFNSEQHHWSILRDAWNERITKRDTVWILGDVCFKAECLPRLDELRGHKRIVLGNHDLDAKHFLPYVDYVGALERYKGYWLSHAPLHPDELRGRNNIHGHVHYATLKDKRYFNVCPENIGMAPVPFEYIAARCPLERG
jgi:calcineurin-like phosphoesterase family protein